MYLARHQIRSVILSVLSTLDHDIYKGFLPDTSEDIELAEERMDELIDAFEKSTRVYEQPELRDSQTRLTHARTAGSPQSSESIRGTSSL